jgi:glycosyltransferase involved in cell wall biosynthesis
MDDTSKSLSERGIRGLFLVWGSPKGAHRSQFMAEELGIPVEHIYLTPKQGKYYALLKYPFQALKTLVVLARWRPQVVLVQNPPIFAPLMVYLWGLVTGAKYIIDSHTDALLASWWGWSLSLHGFLSRRAITTLVTNDHLREMVADWDADAFRLTDVPTIFPKRKQIHLNGNRFNVLYVSTASYDEPISEVLRAARNLPEVGFFITGDYKTNRPDVVQRAPDNVHFTGYVPDEEFYGFFEAVQVVMCLTTENHTMQSGASEALWLGKPIITSNWPMLRGYFSQGSLHVNNTADEITRAVVTMRDSLPAFEKGIQDLRTEKMDEWDRKAQTIIQLIHQALSR